MLSPDATRLEVWGDPISHSRSPHLHTAAYAVLGLAWEYGSRQVSEAAFRAELAGLDRTWRGLSLTMPLKGEAFTAAAVLDRHAELTGAANTLLLDAGGHHGFNTDVGGIVRALAEDGIAAVPTARIIGAGATATSALVAVAELGAHLVEVVARRPEAVQPLRALGELLGVDVVAASFAASRHADVPLTIATLPGDARIEDAAADALASAGGLLLDVVYGHWPTALSEAWARAGRPARSGLGMLLHQAVLQIRIFATGDADAPLEHEDAVIAAMRAAVAPPAA